MPWSLLSGSPRLGEAAAARGLSSDGLVRRARLLGALSSLLLVWAASGLAATLLSGRVDPAGVAALGVAPAALGALVLLLASRAGERRALLHAAAALATLALVLATAGHLMHPRGAPLRPLVPPGFGDDPSAPGALALALGLVVLPILLAARLRAMRMAFDASGSDAGSPAALWRALAQRGLDDAPRAARAPLGALRRWGEAWLLPGLLALDLLATPAARLLDRARGLARDRLHADAGLDALAEGLAEEGCQVERQGRALRVRLPDAQGGVRVAPARLAFPPVEADRVLDVTGAPGDLLRLRRLVEGPLGARCVFAWSRVGRRVEARLNALLHDAQRAATLEERGLLLEEADRMEAALARRRLSGEEWSILVAWKLQRLRGALVHRMLAEPPGARPEGRAVAPAPTLPPPLARLMEAGGLAAMRRALFVPHWVVPVRTPWGEREVVVNALTGKADALDGPRLLDAMTRRGPPMLLDAARPQAFLPAPVPTAALLRELRPLGEVRPDALDALETVYVPFVPGPEGHVNAVTGNAAPDLGAVVPSAA